MRKLYNLFLIALIAAAHSGHAQVRPVNILQGQIIDDSTHEPLSFATIAGPRNAVNTMSNETGLFIIKLAGTTPGDSVVITHVGYRAVSLAVRGQQTSNLVIQLKQKPVQLSEAYVTGIGAINIIQKAIAHIPDNYAVTPYRLGGFYRLTSRADNRIVELSESVFDIFGTDYTNESRQFRLVKTRLDKDLVAFGWNGITKIKRPQGLINIDVIGHIHQASVLGDKQQLEHDFIYHGVVDYEGRPAYEITYDQRPDIKRAFYRGTILIDTQSMAFLMITRALSPRGLQYWYLHSQLDKAALDRENLGETTYNDSTTITYQRYGNRYYLHHYYRLNSERLTGGNREPIDLDPLVNETNYLVTSVDTADAHPFEQKDLIAPTATIEFQRNHNTLSNDNFWENYNLIEANFNVDSAVYAIRRRNVVRR